LLTAKQTNNDDYICSLEEVLSCFHTCALALNLPSLFGQQAQSVNFSFKSGES